MVVVMILTTAEILPRTANASRSNTSATIATGVNLSVPATPLPTVCSSATVIGDEGQ